MEQIEPIVFVSFSFKLEGTEVVVVGGKGAIGNEGQESGSCLVWYKNKGMHQKTPTPGLERQPQLLCLKTEGCVWVLGL